MKKKFALGTIAIAACCTANAQSSVTIYGTLDLGLWHQSKTSGSVPSTDAGSASSLNTGGTAPSVLGVRGEEALGGELKVSFNLETHLDPSIGSSGLGTFWSRAANVGLNGAWGTVKLGQQLNPAILGYAATDPRGLRESLSGVLPWAMSSAQNFGPDTASPNNILAFFSSNAISYANSVGDASFALLYSLGEVAGNSRANRVLDGQLTYAGPLTLSASFHQSRWASTGEKSDEKRSIGAGLKLGAFNIKANYLFAKAFASTGALSGDWRLLGIGGDFQLSDSRLITAAYYRGKNKLDPTGNNEADNFVVSAEEALSRRTTLYAQFAGVKAGQAADAVVSIIGQPVQNAKGFIKRLEFTGALASMFGSIDCMIIPTLPMPVPSLAQMSEYGANPDVLLSIIRFTAPFDLSGTPTITLPNGFDGNGLPTSMQLAGPRLSEHVLIRAAHAYQRVTDWHLKEPQMRALAKKAGR